MAIHCLKFHSLANISGIDECSVLEKPPRSMWAVCDELYQMVIQVIHMYRCGLIQGSRFHGSLHIGHPILVHGSVTIQGLRHMCNPLLK